MLSQLRAVIVIWFSDHLTHSHSVTCFGDMKVKSDEPFVSSFALMGLNGKIFQPLEVLKLRSARWSINCKILSHQRYCDFKRWGYSNSRNLNKRFFNNQNIFAAGQDDGRCQSPNAYYYVLACILSCLRKHLPPFISLRHGGTGTSSWKRGSFFVAASQTLKPSSQIFTKILAQISRVR